uniref:Putative secreted peptide n=1 Tax=Anopheles braziliensis TaxID=58242 RepID=A0A2M3ZV27_9DIPT
MTFPLRLCHLFTIESCASCILLQELLLDDSFLGWAAQCFPFSPLVFFNFVFPIFLSPSIYLPRYLLFYPLP